MRIAVMGAGGVGGCLGGLLAKGGADVTLIAKGPHLQAIRERGIQVKSQLRDFTVWPASTDNPAEVEPVELVLFAVKTHQNASAIPLIKSLVSRDTAILTLQNGVESAQELEREFGPGPVLPGTAYIASHIESPGVICLESPTVRIAFGEADGRESLRTLAIQETFAKAGIQADLSSDPTKVVWGKFLVNGPGNGITSAARTPIRRLVQIPEASETFLGAMKEVQEVGRAKGINFDPEWMDQGMRRIQSYPMDWRYSMLTDLEAGRPLELEALVGAVVRIGAELGVPTPIHRLLYSVLLPHKDGATGST